MICIINLEDNRFNYRQKGFTSIINQLIEMCYFHYKKYNDFNIHVSDYRVEVFFDLPKKNIINEETYVVSTNYLEEFFKIGFPDYNAHNVVSESDIQIRNFIFNNVFKLKEKFKFNSNNYDIGIQIRGTDKKNEITEIPINNIINKLSEFIETNDGISTLFIATDEKKYITEIKKKFTDKIIIFCEENILSEDGNPIHFIDNKKIIDYQVIRDSYILSNCKNLFYCYSNVSLLSIMIGYNNHSSKFLLN